MTAGRRASKRLLADKEELARTTTRALYLDMPQLDEKYGEVGRERCLEDMRYNLEHLAPAVDLGNPGMFASYVQWLNDLLRARNIATEEVRRSLELTESEVRQRFAADEVEAVVPCIRAGLDALQDRRDTV